MRRYVYGSTPALLGLAAAAALIAAPPAAARPAPAPADPSCAPTGSAFPLTTRIHGGPTAYEAGGGFRTWYLDLINTTRRTCEGIHPVVVLVDERHALKPSQARLEFYDGPRTRAVRFESTDEDELVGAFGGAGFTVGPGKTLSVKVRLAVAADAVPNEVTVNAAVVQRHGDDGDWVGQSDDYRFGIGSAPGTRPDTTSTPTGTPTGTPTPTPTPTSTPTSTRESLPFTDAAEELASTGPAVAAAALAALALLLVTVGAILRARGRR
ncbi:hypothetical protein ABZT06_30835 [Streptomyces sp. NPDC005483]|uniref:hypothetical protein n=1 Tax=Streptomyces sp. NPDC005483 TaxID=3154882 RepID=UPI0033AC1B8F